MLHYPKTPSTYRVHLLGAVYAKGPFKKLLLVPENRYILPVCRLEKELLF